MLLSIAEEIMLLLLEDDKGGFVHVPEISMRCILSGAVLMELALMDKIDTDLERLIVVDSEPVDDEILDPILRRLAEDNEQHDTRHWVELCSTDADDIRRRALNRLCQAGILEKKDDRFLWMFKTRRYPLIDGKIEREVKHRIMSILFSDEIPEPRDIIIIVLVDACGLFRHLLSEKEHKRTRERISAIRKMDLIGQAVTNSVREIEASLALALHPPF
ncbi:MAG: GPP34 family phosphoprotein [Rhodobacteraceae bacterium]|nr:GPP34 family phosphoprotein [Paracoccaceae bacterium]